MSTAEQLLQQVRLLNEEKKYTEVAALLPSEILEKYKNAELWFQKGRAYYYNKDYNNAIESFVQAIKIDSNFPYAYNALGSTYNSQRNYAKSIENFNRAIEIDPSFFKPYNGLGNAFTGLGNYEKAIQYFSKAIELDPNSAFGYNGLGNAYYYLKNYEKAIENYNKAIEIDLFLALPHIGKAFVYQSTDKDEKAIDEYNKYIELNQNSSDYFTSLAKEKIRELEKSIKSRDYGAVSEIVKKIKDLLLFKDQWVTHYTSLSVTKILILKEDSLFRLSEGAFLNDTSEGRELFDFLPPFLITSVRSNSTEAKAFVSKPFIGSFVAQNKHDDLTLWRMYGKEDKEEARGCAITIERENLLENLKNALIPDDKDNSPGKIDEEFNFYRVAYRKQDYDDGGCFVVPGAPDKEQALNSLMTDLLNKVKVFLKKNTDSVDTQNTIELLNRIAFLFKSFEYQYEHELRLVVKGTGFKKNVDANFDPPRVYINLVSVRPLIKRITLGPKVERAEEWACAFYYSLDKEDLHPEILISHLPFK